MSPLAAIVGYAELLRTRDDDELRDEASEAIVVAAEQLKSAVNALVYQDERPSPLPTSFGRLGSSRPRSRVARRRVLIVEDEPLLRTLLRTTLSSELFEVWEASNGAAALAAVSGEEPSLVLLDWQLPDLPGSELLSELRARFPRLPVIVVTAAREPDQRRLAEGLGADVFLTKPFSPLELLSAIESLLTSSEELRDERPELYGRKCG